MVVVINKLLNSRFELIISFKAIDVDILILFYFLLYMIFSKCKSSQSMTARKIHMCLHVMDHRLKPVVDG